MSRGNLEWAYAKLRFAYDEVVSEVVNRDWRLPPRPWREFFERFSVPKRDWRSWTNRLLANTSYYQTNYLMIAGACLLYFVVRNPWSVFVAGALTVLWTIATSPKPLIVRSRRIRRVEKFWAATLVSTLLLVLSGMLLKLLKTMSVAFVFILVHGSFRHYSIGRKMSDLRLSMRDNW